MAGPFNIKIIHHSSFRIPLLAHLHHSKTAPWSTESSFGPGSGRGYKSSMHYCTLDGGQKYELGITFSKSRNQQTDVAVYLLGFQGSSLRGWCFRDSAVSIFRAVTDSRLTPHIYNTTKLWRILGSDYYVYW